MQYFVTGFLLLAGFLFWGAGLAFLVTPRVYRRFALIFAVPAGLALQSLVVWAGAHTALSGTNAYGRASLVLPAALLAVALWRNRGERATCLARFWPVVVLMVVQLGVMLTPPAISSRELATVSVGRNDAGDYAAGARVFQEFAAHERNGFIGQTAVVSVGVVDNFFDFWLRTNHFTPSALIALNASILGLKPFQLTGILTIVLLTATLPLVFWLMRSGLGFRSWPSLAITAIYAFNPLNWYAVYNVAPAQILAANMIALLTWCGLVLWRRRNRRTQRWALAGLLFIAYGLLLGSYNSMVVVCLVPVIAVAGGQALGSRLGVPFARWLGLLLAPLVLAGVVYWERSAGIMERFILFRAPPFWRPIPPMRPEGWLGITDGTWLRNYSGWPGLVLMAVASLFILWGLVGGFRRFPKRAYVACALTVPIMAGYALLEVRAAFVNPGTSHDAYELFSVFYPGMLAAFCLWIDVLARAPLRTWRVVGLVGAVALVLANIGGQWRYLYRFSNPGLIADSKLARLGEIEKIHNVYSLNIRLSDSWERIWANGFLLRKKQYFEWPTYEGRTPTAMAGQWDLVGNFFKFDLPVAADCLHPVEGFTLLLRSSPFYLQAALDEGWSGKMVLDDPNLAPRTRWAAAETALLQLNNPQATPLWVRFRSTLRAFGTRECEIKIGEQVVARLALSEKPREWLLAGFSLPPGTTKITFTTFTPADWIGGRQKRPMTLALDGLDIQVLASPPVP